MTYPEGYRKAMRVIVIADRHGFPVISPLSTPPARTRAWLLSSTGGAAGSPAPSSSLLQLGVPAVSCIIGEGGSGGAVAMSPSQTVSSCRKERDLSVIYAEAAPQSSGATQARPKKAAAAFKPDAVHCLELGVIDGVVPEPPGGAHEAGCGRRAAGRIARDRPRRGQKAGSRRAEGANGAKKFRRMGIFLG